jgi:hypothetical protein
VTQHRCPFGPTYGDLSRKECIAYENRRPVDSHFGAWVVCTESPAPCSVAAIDENGAVLGSIQLSERPLQW